MKRVSIDGEQYIREKDVIQPEGDASNPYLQIGLVYFIRTVTNYFTGRLIWVGDKEFVFEDACWIADTGRFNEFLKDKNNVSESEPFIKDSKVIIGRGALIDMVEYEPSLILSVK